MKSYRWRLVWLAIAAANLLSGCGAGDSLSGLGKGMGDLFKGFKLP